MRYIVISYTLKLENYNFDKCIGIVVKQLKTAENYFTKRN